jgi:hypothetical protein
VEGVGEEDVIDQLRQDSSDDHSVRRGKPAVAGAGRSDPSPRPVQHRRVYVDGVDAKRDACERGCEQPVTATEINDGHAGLDAHIDEDFRGIRSQRPPHSASGIVVAGKKPTVMRLSGDSIGLMIDWN